MSTEAAYFPDALANTTEVGEALRDAPENLARPSGDTSELPRVGVDQFSDSTDERLLEEVRNGAKEALGLLFRRHARSVRNVAFRILRNEAEAEDLVQEVFLFIFRKAALFDPAHGLARSWIIHVTYHRAFDRRRYLNSRHFYTSQELEDTASSMADTKKPLTADNLMAPHN